MQQEIRVSDPRSEAMLNAYHQVVVERLEQGLEDIQASSLQAMREIAIEIWRTSGAQGDDLQKHLLAAISKDESLRGVMELSDERFQNLSLRVSQIDDSLLAMSNATRELRSLVVSGAWGRSGEADAGTEALEASALQLGARIDEIERHLAAAFQNLAQRDAQLLEAVQDQVAAGAGAGGDSGDRVATLEAQLASGAGAMTALVDAVRQEVAQLNVLAARENDTDPAQISATLDDRLSRLAGLVRSDSRAIAELVQSQSEAQAAALAETLDQRLGRMSEIVSATTMAAVNEVARSVPEQAADALSKRVDEVVAAIDKNFVDLVDVTETEMHRVGRLIADRTAAQTATQVDTAISGRLDGTVARLTNAAEVMERSASTAPAAAAATGLSEAAGEDLAAIVDARVTALAKMIRSDNKAMAQVMQVAAEQQAAKQAARVAMEMAANLPQQIMETLDRRFAEFAQNMHSETQSTVVAVAKAADVLAQRIDRTAGAVNEKHEADLAAMNDRFGRAVHEIATRIQ